jgi:pSer/pThr/pTyr-binding forkhead associated (FHA) protein
MLCNQCGHRNQPGSNFCSSCGAALDPGASDDTTITFVPSEEHHDAGEAPSFSVDDLPAGVGMLIVSRGPNEGSRYLLDTEVTTAGRHPDSEIFLDDITVSRRHAEIVRQGDNQYLVRDVGSLNGTYVNRDRVDEASLRHGDEVQIGKFKLVFCSR